MTCLSNQFAHKQLALPQSGIWCTVYFTQDIKGPISLHTHTHTLAVQSAMCRTNQLRGSGWLAQSKRRKKSGVRVLFVSCVCMCMHRFLVVRHHGGGTLNPLSGVGALTIRTVYGFPVTMYTMYSSLWCMYVCMYPCTRYVLRNIFFLTRVYT